jgi:4-hydroxybenzoyl-CoA reductase subunit beta
MTEVLTRFDIVSPTSLTEALAALAETPGSRACAGGTDLVPNLRRGLSETGRLVDLTRIADLQGITASDAGLRIGAGVRLADLEHDPVVAAYTAVVKAAAVIAGPTHREVATVGGNLCLDTRCLYYNQSHWWRKSNDFCLKYRGEICHVAPQGNRCRAAFSGDLAPALMVHGAEIEIASADGTRRLPLTEFYDEDGAAHLRLNPGEIVVAVHLPPSGARSDYAKIRVRGAVDFPLAGVAVALDANGGKNSYRVAITGTNSKPFEVETPGPMTEDPDAWFAALEKAVQKAVSPQRTTTIAAHYRRLSVSALAARLARALAVA